MRNVVYVCMKLEAELCPVFPAALLWCPAVNIGFVLEWMHSPFPLSQISAKF